jgi:hypothetical protein
MPDLTKRRILAAVDLGSLESYCIASGQVGEMERWIAKEPVGWLSPCEAHHLAARP